MENAVDALKMAGSVLLFVIALSVAILAFSQSREAIDAVLKYSDRESLMIENDSRFYYLANSNDTQRYVGKETIIPAIYRAYKENFKIVFKFPAGSDEYLYEDSSGNKISTIDLSKQSLGSDLESRQFLDGIIYYKYGYEINTATGTRKATKTEYERKFKITLPTSENKALFNYISDKEDSYKIKEELGTYYIEDIYPGTELDSNVNKTEKRVITYTFVNK